MITNYLYFIIINYNIVSIELNKYKPILINKNSSFVTEIRNNIADSFRLTFSGRYL